MSKVYFLWHWKSGNIVGEFETPEEVIDVLARSFGENDIERVREYFVEVYEQDDGTMYADSDELVKLVEKHMHAMSP